MRQSWTTEELTEHWSLLPDERRLLHDKMEKHKLIFAVMLKSFQYMGRFPEDLTKFPKVIVNYLATYLNLTTDGKQRINRINYEMEVLQTLRGKIRCKEVWVKNSYRYRDPDEDLPKDFDEKKDDYFKLLKQPPTAEEFIIKIQQLLRENLIAFNKSIPKNNKVKLIIKKQNGKQKGWITLAPLTAQPEPVNIEKLKISTNSRDDQELAILSLHLLQICLVYINTLNDPASASTRGLEKYLNT